MFGSLIQLALRYTREVSGKVLIGPRFDVIGFAPLFDLYYAGLNCGLTEMRTAIHVDANVAIESAGPSK